MSNVVISQNMNLPVPIVGQESGPEWATDLNNCLALVDAHNHAPGYGVQINPNGININSDLAFNGNNATLLRSARLSNLSSAIAAGSPDLGCLYQASNELYFNDGAGNQVKLTSAGAVNATSSGLSSGNASASFVSSVLVVDSAVSTPGSIDIATLILRYPGSYPTPSGNYIAIECPSSLATGYAFILPATTPGSSGALLTSDTSGNISYSFVDGATLSSGGGVLSVATSGIQTANLAAASVTGPKLAAVNYQKSASVTKTTTAGLGIVTGLAVTITTTGRPVMVFLQTASWTGSNYGFLGAYSGVAHFNIYRSDVADYISGIELRDNVANNNGTQYAPSSVSYLDFPSAGTYTYQIYLGANGGSLAQINECVLVAYEVF